MRSPDSISPPSFASDEVHWFWRYISSSLERLIETTLGLSVDELDWRPPALDTNSIHVLVVHTIANAEDNLLGTLCGHHVERDREGEFGAVARTAEDLARFWSARLTVLERALGEIKTGQLSESYSHPRRGQVAGRDLLMIVARHAAEHLGQAELTRDLAVAARTEAG